MKADPTLVPRELAGKLERMWELSTRKILAGERSYDQTRGSPVFTVGGVWTSRGWTEWTQGFQYGSAILQYDATGEKEFLEIGRKNTVEKMAAHLTHVGVHDHGFNNVSTYGNLLRLMNEGRIPENPWERSFYELALKSSGAVQARRWTRIADGGGHLLLQRAALPVRGHHPFPALPGPGPPPGACAHGRERPPGVAAPEAD